MTRMLSTFAMAGWTGYHAVSAFALAAPVASAAGFVPAGPALTAAVHAALAVGALGASAMFQASAERTKAETVALIVLAIGIALSAAVFLAGHQGADAGLYASSVALTLAAFSLDRFMGSQDGEEEVDHEAFMRRAAELGAEMGRPADMADRRAAARR